MLRLAADENFNHDILRGLLRRRPDIDIVAILTMLDWTGVLMAASGDRVYA